MTSNRQTIFETVRRLAVIKGADVTKERVQLYTEILSKYETRKVLKALGVLATESKFFPDVAEIIALADPKMDENALANEAAGAIIESISRFGSYRGQEAEEYLGPRAWHIVSQAGGWATLCQTTNSNLNTLRAQMRDLAKATNQRALASPNQIEAPYQKEGLRKIQFKQELLEEK